MAAEMQFHKSTAGRRRKFFYFSTSVLQRSPHETVLAADTDGTKQALLACKHATGKGRDTGGTVTNKTINVDGKTHSAHSRFEPNKELILEQPKHIPTAQTRPSNPPNTRKSKLTAERVRGNTCKSALRCCRDILGNVAALKS